MDIAYAAHTNSCIFMLDEEGVCRWVVTRGAQVSRQTVENAQRCIGAQYVASLDVDSPGGLLAAPQVGAQMLFAVVGPEGRIALARSGTVTSFEDRRPGAASGQRHSIPTLPYNTFGVGSGARALPTAESSQSLEIDVDYMDATETDGNDDERTRLYRDRGRRASSTPPPPSRPRATRLPQASAVPPPSQDPHRCETGRYLPVEARALRHLARLKK